MPPPSPSFDGADAVPVTINDCPAMTGEKRIPDHKPARKRKSFRN